MTLSVEVQEAEARLSELLERVESGEVVVLSCAGCPIAELRPVGQPDLIFGGFDVTIDDRFFEPLADDELAGWTGSRREN